MKTVIVTYSNGDVIETRINTTNDEILQYFAVGDVRNIGRVYDNMQSIVSVGIKEERDD